MLQLESDRVGRGFCARCKFEVPENTTYQDMSWSFGGGYGQLCDDCEIVSEQLFYFHGISNDAHRYIEDLENGRWEKWVDEFDKYDGDYERVHTLDQLREMLTGNPWNKKEN